MEGRSTVYPNDITARTFVPRCRDDIFSLGLVGVLWFPVALPTLALFMGSSILCELIICYFVGIGAIRAALQINLIGFCIIAFAIVPFMSLVGVLQGACLALALGDVIRLALAFRCLWKVVIAKS